MTKSKKNKSVKNRIKYFVYGNGLSFFDDIEDAKECFVGINPKKCINGYKSFGVDYRINNKRGAVDVIVFKNGRYIVSNDYKSLTISDTEVLDYVNEIIDTY